MKTRAITGFFFIIVMVGSMLLGDVVFSVFYLLLSLACLHEFYKILKSSGIKPHQLLGLGLSAAIFGLLAIRHYADVDNRIWLILIPLASLIFITELYKKDPVPFANLSYTFVGLIYIIIPFCFFHELGFLGGIGTYDWALPLAFFCLLWGNDTGAYLFGVKFGKTKLFERHSPKKSWEGFFGGVFTGIVIAYIFSTQFQNFSFLEWAGMAILISCIGTLGDLVESMLKRSFNTKDSGGLLPGHGGLLDRFDGLFLSAPLVYTYILLLI